jgi:hypothetical protein
MNMIRHAAAALPVLAGALLAHPASAQTREEAAEERPAQTERARAPRIIVQAGTGFSFTSGDYGRADSTDVYSVPLNLRVRRGDWSLRLGTSYVTIKGQAAVIDVEDGDGSADGGTATPGSSTREGFGDLSLTLARRFDLGEATAFTGEVRVKFPTASQAERLTTGTTDVTLRARLAQEVGDVTLRAGAQRRFAGGQGRVALRDTWGASAGASLDLGERLVTGIDLDWQQSSFATSGDRTSITAFLSAPLSRRMRLTGYGATGLSTNSPDLTVGASLSLRLD